MARITLNQAQCKAFITKGYLELRDLSKASIGAITMDAQESQESAPTNLPVAPIVAELAPQPINIIKELGFDSEASLLNSGKHDFINFYMCNMIHPVTREELDEFLAKQKGA